MALFWWGDNSPNAPKNRSKSGGAVAGTYTGWRWSVSVHEAGHYVIGKKLGGWGAHSYLKESRQCGWTEIHMPDLRSDAIMCAAGTEAANLEFGWNYETLRGDREDMIGVCRRANKKGDPITPKEAVAIANQMCRRYRSEILRVAERIYTKGHS